MSKKILLFLNLFIILALNSCKDEKVTNLPFKPYDGPIGEVYQMNTLFTDSARTKMRVRAPKELEYENGDQQFPDGINIEFYNTEKDTISSTLVGNSARYIKKEDIYIVTGNVIVKSVSEQKQLNTEELKWNPKTKKITSDKAVKIHTPCEILDGEGLDANEDFTYYKITKPTASIFLDCDE